MPKYEISIETQPNSKQIDFVQQQLYEFNVGKIGDYQYTPLFLFLRDSEQKVVGWLGQFYGLGMAPHQHAHDCRGVERLWIWKSTSISGRARGC